MEDNAGETKNHPSESGRDNLIVRLLSSCVSFVHRNTYKSNNEPHSISTTKASTPLATRNRIQKRTNQPNNMENEKPTADRSTPLYRAIADETFWSMPENQLLNMIAEEFPNELARLKNAYSVKSTGIQRPSINSISCRLYGREFDEINRTLVGVLALRWIHDRDYNTFIGKQGPRAVVLTTESFDWICDLFDRGLQTPDDIYTLVLSMIINDLGKDPSLATDYATLEDTDISRVNHDMILYYAVEAGMVPALDRLTRENKENMLVGIRLGSQFNFGQLAQAENAPASLSGLLEMRGYDRAFELRFMEQVLDLSGASGHEDWTCARKMIEPIFQSYKNVFAVAGGIISGKVNLRDGYDIILTRKLELLQRAGYKHHFDVRKPTDRALLRLFCMGNTNNTQDATIYQTAFEKRISREVRNTLIYGLNVDGGVGEPAVQPTYIPAMLTKATANAPSDSQKDKINVVAVVLKYLAKCLIVDKHRLDKLPRGVTVIERDVRKVDKVVSSEEFKKNPNILDEEDIPEDQVANKI